MVWVGIQVFYMWIFRLPSIIFKKYNTFPLNYLDNFVENNPLWMWGSISESTSLSPSSFCSFQWFLCVQGIESGRSCIYSISKNTNKCLQIQFLVVHGLKSRRMHFFVYLFVTYLFSVSTYPYTLHYYLGCKLNDIKNFVLFAISSEVLEV